MNKNINLQVPVGVRDVLPMETTAIRQLEQKLTDFFYSWGYQELMTPTFEFAETFKAGSPAGSDDVLFKFIDRQGRVLALRPEMTAPIARLVVTSLRREPLPLRLCYRANVFRYEEPHAGRQREFHQAGVELIGADGVAADVEIIALAVETLIKVGLKDFRLGLGQVAVTKGVLNDLELTPEDLAKIKEALAKKDLVLLERLSEEYKLTGIRRKQLELLSRLHGGAEALREAQECFSGTGAAKPLADLEQVWQALVAYGLEQWLFIDLGILRDFDYYTGVVFEGYVSGLGAPVCGGGRYNDLLAQFGYPCPATGFAVGLERLLLALKGSLSKKQDKGYLVAGSDVAAVLKKAQEIRQSESVVVFDNQSKTREEAAGQAEKRGLNLIWLE
ncbi:MAG: phosphoribosyltransferase regulatory subunit [Clostridia bacterium]|nr:phosphoribosyltransferase regulatory subunit [Clostridia bacterium]